MNYFGIDHAIFSHPPPNAVTGQIVRVYKTGPKENNAINLVLHVLPNIYTLYIRLCI